MVLDKDAMDAGRIREDVISCGAAAVGTVDVEMEASDLSTSSRWLRRSDDWLRPRSRRQAPTATDSSRWVMVMILRLLSVERLMD